jgi:predicted alpha/beta-fold hydrolase
VIHPAQDFRTIAGYASRWLAPPPIPPAQPWETTLEDRDVGELRLSGELRDPGGARELCLIVHGLGGSPASTYCRLGARAAAARGAASLTLSLRGADRRGEDFYNIALREDLAAAVASPALARYERIYVLGYSMGGYVALHYARGPLDPRVRAVAALCTPIDLHAAQRHIDSPRAWIYRQHVLSGLKRIYAAVAARGRRVPSDPRAVRAVRTIYDWDRLAIAPRYGYASPEAYYRALSIEPYLGSLAVPALLVAAEDDPVVPPHTIRPYLPRMNGSHGAFEVRFAPRGGHLGFARGFDLGLGPERGLEAQVFAWCAQRP